jgi:small subunit ribosomal protein S21
VTVKGDSEQKARFPNDGTVDTKNPSRLLPGARRELRSVTYVVADDNESFDSLLRRFKKKVQGDRILSEIRKRRFFEQPSIVRKRKRAAKLRKSRRTSLKDRRRQY